MNNTYLFDEELINKNIKIKKFIEDNLDKCFIVSDNKLGNNYIKYSEVDKYKNNNIISIVYNDVRLLEVSNLGIVYNNISNVLDKANFAFYNERKLYNFLNKTLDNTNTNDNTIIISCAGMGTRLGMEIPKCLVKVGEKSLIERFLEYFKDVSDLRVVVGYKKEEVINSILKINKNVTIVFNNEYMHNKTGASVCKAIPYSNKYIITIDGDLLIHPSDINKILNSDIEFVGVTKASTDNPMLAVIDNNNVVDFKREYGTFEWTGISRFDKDKLVLGEGHVCDLLKSMLPLPYLYLNTKEIDTPNDLEHALKWVKNNYSDNIVIGVVGGMGSVATTHFFTRLVNSFNVEKEWERPRIIIDNRCNVPSRVRGILYGERVDEIIESVSDTIKMLDNNGSDYIVLTCNTLHYYLDEILKRYPNYKDKMINMIELLSLELSKRNIKKFTLLASEGTYLSKIYDKYLSKYGIKYSKVVEEEIRKYIESVKQLKINENVKKDFIEFINNLDDDIVVLGCTELPIIYSLCKDKIKKEVYDPLECVIDYLDKKQEESIDIYKNSKVKYKGSV